MPDHPDHDALIETMLLAAGADGSITKAELETIFARIYSRPEFSRFEKDNLRASVESAAKRVTGYKTVREAAEAVTSRLHSVTARELAFRSAAAVALVDHRADWRELETLKALQDAFGLTDARVVSLFEQAEDDAEQAPNRPAR